MPGCAWPRPWCDETSKSERQQGNATRSESQPTGKQSLCERMSKLRANTFDAKRCVLWALIGLPFRNWRFFWSKGWDLEHFQQCFLCNVSWRKFWPFLYSFCWQLYIASSQPNPINCKMKFQLNFNRFTICVHAVYRVIRLPTSSQTNAINSRLSYA